MRRQALVGLVLAAFILGASVSAATAATGELSASPGTIEAEPGDRVEVTLTLEHTGSNTTAYIVDGDLPDGFVAENSSVEVQQEGNAKWLLPTLEPGASMTVSFDLHVPEDAAGSYELPIVAETVDGVQARTTLTVDTPGERTETATAVEGTDADGTDGTESGTNGTDNGDNSGANAMENSASASSAPGFGVVVALIALGTAMVAISRRET